MIKRTTQIEVSQEWGRRAADELNIWDSNDKMSSKNALALAELLREILRSCDRSWRLPALRNAALIKEGEAALLEQLTIASLKAKGSIARATLINKGYDIFKLAEQRLADITRRLRRL